MAARKPRKMQGRVRERQAKILQIMRTEGATSVTALAARLDCSPMTIRRDLATLAHEGQGMTRYHGAVATRGLVLEQRFQEKMEEAPEAKAAIAHAAAALVEDGAVIGLNGGTTTTRIAERLAAEQKNVTVITNAVNIAMILTNSRLRVIVVGGGLRPSNYETTGAEAVRQLEHLHMEWAFLGANGVHAHFGVSATAAEEAAVGAAFAGAAETVAVVADARKFGQRATHQLLAWDAVDVLIADAAAEALTGNWGAALPLPAPERDGALVWRLRGL